MPIIPSGKRKIMEAQSSLGSNQWGFGGGQELDQNDVSPQTGITQQEEAQPLAGTEEELVQPKEAPSEGLEESQGKPDILEYVYKVLEKLGYPPRRLDAFSDEFINEKMFPGGVKEITITLPDRYYGQKKRISDNDLSKIMNSIQEQYGLTLTDAERKEKKVIMNFTSQPQEAGIEEEVPGDDLDEIFGTPKGPENVKQKAVAKPAKNPKNKRMAKTIHELVKESHNDIVNKLMVVAASLGENK